MDSPSQALKATAKRAVRIAAIATVYVAAAKFGLLMDAVGGFATLVWPPTGIALSALLIFGRGVWPAIAIGAFAANLTAHAPVAVALGIAIGNTLEAVVGAAALQQLARFDRSLERLRDVVALVSVAAVLSTVVSATIGTTSLWLGSVIASDEYLATWRAWWLGDMMGDLVFAPLLLVWTRKPTRRTPWHEALVMTVALVGAAAFVFLRGRDGSFLQQPYVTFPFLIWAAVRFGPRGATAAIACVSAIAITATVLGYGPFVRAKLSESLLFLQAYMAVAAVATLILAAVISERDRALSLRDLFVSTASHEIKSPMTTMSLQVERLKRQLSRDPADVDREIVSRTLDRLAQQLDQLLKLIERLLDVSRIATGGVRLDPEQVDLSAVVRDVIERSRDELTARGYDVEIHADAPVEGVWDRARVEQVVTNLLTNAMRYGEGKPITMSISTVGAFGRLRVRDAGVGIADKDRARIFHAFQRASDDRIGLGLGLHIVREIVTAHGGTITVDSRMGVGSTFTVELPLRRFDARAKGQPGKSS
jgi:signal transduction histidine kinase